MSYSQVLDSPLVVADNQDLNFQELISSLSVMFYVAAFNPDLELEYVSPAFECLGYTTDEIYADPDIMYRWIHPDDLKRIKEANKPVYDGELLETDYEYRVYSKTGEMRWWKDCGRPIFNEKGERVKWVGVIYDITARKIAEDRLITSKEELEAQRRELSVSNKTNEAILESIGDLLVVVDDDGIIEKVNESATEMMGYTEEEFVGQPVSILTQKKTFLTDEEFETMLSKRRLLDVRKEFVCKEGSKIQVSISSSVRKDHKEGAVIVAKDVRRRIKRERDLETYANRLEQSNRELEEFAYVASHDLQEPLRKIQAFGDRLVLKCTESLPEEGRDYVYRMKNAADRMQRLINDLLTFSRVTTKCQPFQAVDFGQIASEVISDLEVRISETEGTIEVDDLPVIDADPSQIRQLLQNLVSNALKFHRPGVAPHVTITSTVSTGKHNSEAPDDGRYSTSGTESSVCQIIVQDNGIGFDEKYGEKIFTVFQRLHGRGAYEGSGIGLAVCRKIVERHGGGIIARSIPDHGSSFVITLPKYQPQEEIQ